MPAAPQPLLAWLKSHPGIFSSREDGDELALLENYSRKELRIKGGDVERIEEKSNPSQGGQSYLVLLFANGRQLVLAPQGFVFPPDFSSTGPLPLPSPVYCMQDFNNIFHRLQHVAAEHDRKHEALDMIMLSIALLDGARAVGLDVDEETRAVEVLLADLEKGSVPPDPHPDR